MLILCVVLSFVACGGDEETPDGMKNIAGENDAYYFYVPQSWVQNQFGVGAYYSTIDPSNVSVAAYSGESYTDSNQYIEALVKGMDGISENFTMVSEKEAKVIGGRNAVQYVYTFTTDGVDYKVMQIFVGYSNIMYVITYTAFYSENEAENRYEFHLADVQKMLDTFKFK